MHRYEVGKKYPELSMPNDGIKFNFTDGGATLTVNLKGITDEELTNIQAGDIEYNMLYYRDVIWIFFKFGSLNWMDAPFSVHLSKNLTRISDLSEGEGYGCTIYLIDNNGGELKAIRLIGFSTRFSKALQEAMEHQKEKPFDVTDYDNNLNQTMMSYSTNQLLKMARVRGKITRD